MKKTTPRCIGLSSDHRTNRWKVTCPACNHKFEPTTTIFARHAVHCEKCSVELFIDYNDHVVVPMESDNGGNKPILIEGAKHSPG